MDLYLLKYKTICAINQEELKLNGRVLFDQDAVESEEEIDDILVSLFRGVERCEMVRRTLERLQRNPDVVTRVMRDIQRRGCETALPPTID